MNGTFTSHQVAPGNDSITVGWRCAEICADLSSLCIRGSATLTLCYAKPCRLIQSLTSDSVIYLFFLTNYVSQDEPEPDRSSSTLNPAILY